jgi:hypothetical protein
LASGIRVDNDGFRDLDPDPTSSSEVKPRNTCHHSVTFLNIEIERELRDLRMSPLIPYTAFAVVVEQCREFWLG